MNGRHQDGSPKTPPGEMPLLSYFDVEADEMPEPSGHSRGRETDQIILAYSFSGFKLPRPHQGLSAGFSALLRVSKFDNGVSANK